MRCLNENSWSDMTFKQGNIMCFNKPRLQTKPPVKSRLLQGVYKVSTHSAAKRIPSYMKSTNLTCTCLDIIQQMNLIYYWWWGKVTDNTLHQCWWWEKVTGNSHQYWKTFWLHFACRINGALKAIHHVQVWTFTWTQPSFLPINVHINEKRGCAHL